MKFQIKILCVLFLLGMASKAQAFEERRFSLGLLTGFGVGAGNCPAPSCDIPNIGNQRYHFVPVLLAGSYRLDEFRSIRIGIGLDKYVFNSPYTNASKIFVAGEGYYIHHFKNDRELFSPYLLAGFRFPTANIGLGLGIEWNLNERFAVITELLANTFFTLDQRFEGRVGVMTHF